MERSYRQCALEEFMRANIAALLRRAYVLTGSGPAAEDLVQDTLVRLYPQWPRVENADVPLAYVRRSLTNTYLNQRRRGLHREISVDQIPEGPARHSTEKDVTDRDQVQTLLKALNQRQRAALVLRFYGGLSDAQIAENLGCPAGTVRSLISRGLATLRERLDAELTTPGLNG
jgi:RNA polymerase sigma-70 factor (sigma-E family)